jgi:predicted RNase H-like HicB family nuclease
MEQRRRKEWILGEYDIDLATLLKRGTGLTWNDMLDMLTIKGIEKYRRVHDLGRVLGCSADLSIGGEMLNYTAKYTKIPSGYMGQLIEWPEVVTEGKSLEECRKMLQDALREMVQASPMKRGLKGNTRRRTGETAERS